MYLDTEGFKEAFRGVPNCGSEPYGELECMLGKYPKEEREALRQQFFLDLRIMKARTYEEVGDIPIHKLIDCIGSHGLFKNVFDRIKAIKYFTHFADIATVRTCRKRRIL